jgi:dTDP-4-dehydrorhamnose reductase
MRILVAGAHGQLARALLEEAQARAGVSVTALGRPDLDVARPGSIARAIAQVAPDVVINAAAYTAVDKAESEAAAAFAVNRDGAGALAAAAAAHGAPIVHISTDYVFDGSKPGAYVEDDPTGPTGVYGRSKLEGEAGVAAANPAHVILRTAWLYSPWGSNFLLTMLRLARERGELRVVADQRGNPTYAPHLAAAVLSVAVHVAQERPGRPYAGVYHAAGGGSATWHDFACTIVSGAARLGVPQVPVRAIGTADYPTPARRPTNSTLDCSKLARVFGQRLPPWQDGVAACIRHIAQG